MSEQVTDKAREELNLLKAKAVRQATFEVLGESRAEIVKRARAKLVALGVTLGPEDFAELP